MAEEIVACPGCAKKFRIPEGAPPGSFACTACGVDVPYGAAPAKPAARPAAKAAPAARPAAAAAARPAPAPRPAAATQQRVAAAPSAARSRRRARDVEHEAPKKSNTGLIWGGIAVGGIGLVALVYVMTKPKPLPPPPERPPATKPVEAPKPAPPRPETSAAAPAAIPKVPGEAPSPGAKPPVVKVPAPEPKEPAKVVAKTTVSMLGQTFESVAGTTDEERADMDRQVALAADLSSGKDGATAETKLVQMGKKAIPPLLSAFSRQFQSGRWAGNNDQYAADKVLDLLHRITGADGLHSNDDFWPRFMSGATPEDFEKAAKIWINWWNLKGRLKDKFKPRND